MWITGVTGSGPLAGASPWLGACVTVRQNSCDAVVRVEWVLAYYRVARLTSPAPPSRAAAAMPRRADGNCDVVFWPCLQTGVGAAIAAVSAPRSKNERWIISGIARVRAFVSEPGGSGQVCKPLESCKHCLCT